MPVQKVGVRVLRTALTAAGGVGLAIGLIGCNEQGIDPQSQIGSRPALPDIKQYLFPPMNIARVVGWKDGEAPSAASGLRIKAFAAKLAHPRSLYVLPNGDVLVVESVKPKVEPIKRPKDLIMGWIESMATGGGDKESNRITLLRDADGDGVPEVRSVFLDHLNSPFGVALVGDALYVAETDAITRFPYTPGETHITAPGVRLTDLPGGPIDHHWTKSLVASIDGSLLYVGVGSNSNITENGMQAEKGRAAIWEINRASGRSRIFADGLRNPNGLSWEPQSHALWAVVNERDELGPNLVPDYLTSVKDGGFYGWPYSYFGQHLDPRVVPQRPDLVAKAAVPDYALSSHVAPLGLTFYTASALPAKYRGGAFVGEHGSWNRLKPNGYKVVFVPFKDGQPSGKVENVVTDFLNSDGEARGRPVGLAVDRAGALLIADDAGNTVWRVTKAD
jgi:glucose/arabinose dehydrogenase